MTLNREFYSFFLMLDAQNQDAEKHHRDKVRSLIKNHHRSKTLEDTMAMMLSTLSRSDRERAIAVLLDLYLEERLVPPLLLR